MDNVQRSGGGQEVLVIYTSLTQFRVARCAGVGPYARDVVVKGHLGGDVEGRCRDTGGVVGSGTSNSLH